MMSSYYSSEIGQEKGVHLPKNSKPNCEDIKNTMEQISILILFRNCTFLHQRTDMGVIVF